LEVTADLEKLSTDVAIIGCGIAGVTASKQVARRHKKVTIISKAYGATAMSTGVADIANPTVIKIPLESPNALFRKKYAVKKNHPYSLILQHEKHNETRENESSDGVCSETMSKAITDFIHDMTEAGYPVEGSLEHNMLLINSIGSVRSTCLAPSSVAEGDLTRIENGRILFVGFKGHADFDPRFCARNFINTAKLVGMSSRSSEDEGAVIDVPGFEARSTLLSIEVARLIDHDAEVATQIGRKIGDVSKGTGATHLCLPPCIGIRNVQEKMKAIREESGLVPFECVTLTPPSIIGYRLQLALDDLTDKSGIPIMLPYEVTGFDAHERTLRNMNVVSGQRGLKVEAEKFVLATGSFIGGGIIENDETIKEPLLDLPLFDENDSPVHGMYARTMLSSEALPIDGHRIFSVGVKANENMQPVSADGDVIHDNLYACGNILSGFNHTSGGCRYGAAIATGYVAGEEASK
jgi:glycerol-3-phosphate dehydrogenase subunit B